TEVDRADHGHRTEHVLQVDAVVDLLVRGGQAPPRNGVVGVALDVVVTARCGDELLRGETAGEEDGRESECRGTHVTCPLRDERAPSADPAVRARHRECKWAGRFGKNTAPAASASCAGCSADTPRPRAPARRM